MYIYLTVYITIQVLFLVPSDNFKIEPKTFMLLKTQNIIKKTISFMHINFNFKHILLNQLCL